MTHTDIGSDQLSNPLTDAVPLAPKVLISEEWAMIYDGHVDLALTWPDESGVREYIRKGIEEFAQDPAHYGIAMRHVVRATTAWTEVEL